MAIPNYAFAKRQRDLAKKKKNEEKRQRKAAEKDKRSNPEVHAAHDNPTQQDSAAESPPESSVASPIKPDDDKPAV
jgi:hypothetical protein